MKTILYVTNNYHPYTGGVVQSIDACADALRAHGYVVYVVTFDFGESQKNEDSHVIRLRTWCSFRYKKNHMIIPWRMHAQLYDVIARINPDIVHIHHPFLLGSIAARIARSKGIKTVFTHHTFYELYAHYVPIVPRFITRWFIRIIVTSLCNSIDHIIAPSSAVEKDLRQKHIKTPIVIVPSPVHARYVHTATPEKQQHARISLLAVGRFTPEKNWYAVLDAIALLPSDMYRITIIGYGYLEEVLRSYAYEQLKLSRETVVFIRKPAPEIIAEAYASANLFLFTSHTDTQGLVLIESMSAGTPVIALDGPGQRDCIQQGHNGFIVHTVHEMAQIIQRLAHDRDALRALQYDAWQSTQRYQALHIITQLADHVYEQKKH